MNHRSSRALGAGRCVVHVMSRTGVRSVANLNRARTCTTRTVGSRGYGPIDVDEFADAEIRKAVAELRERFAA